MSPILLFRSGFLEEAEESDRERQQRRRRAPEVEQAALLTRSHRQRKVN